MQLHIAVSIPHINEFAMTLASYDTFVYAPRLRHDSWIVGHSVVLWSNEESRGWGLKKR